MSNTKEYVISYNRYSGKVVHHPSEQQAIDTGVKDYKVITADSYGEAKDEFLDMYKENNVEHE